MTNHTSFNAPLVVHATATDLGILAGVLRRGFEEEPAQKWLFPNRHYRRLASELWFRGMIREGLMRNTVWRTEDNSSAAVWFEPGARGSGTGLEEKLLRLLIKINRRTAHIKAELDHELQIRRPREPHWYLAAVATNAKHRSQGRGRAVLCPALQTCDREHMPAYLETSAPRSVKFYVSLGFNVLSLISLRDGPEIWCMGRPRH